MAECKVENAIHEQVHETIQQYQIISADEIVGPDRLATPYKIDIFAYFLISPE